MKGTYFRRFSTASYICEIHAGIVKHIYYTLRVARRSDCRCGGIKPKLNEHLVIDYT